MLRCSYSGSVVNARILVRSVVVDGDGVVDVEGAVLGEAAVDGLAKVGFKPVTHQFAEVALVLELVVVDVVAEHRGRHVRTVLDGLAFVRRLVHHVVPERLRLVPPFVQGLGAPLLERVELIGEGVLHPGSAPEGFDGVDRHHPEAILVGLSLALHAGLDSAVVGVIDVLQFFLFSDLGQVGRDLILVLHGLLPGDIDGADQVVAG